MPGSKDMVKTRSDVKFENTLGTATFLLSLNMSPHLLQFSASRLKFSSLGSLTWNSSGSHPYLKSGKIVNAQSVTN